MTKWLNNNNNKIFNPFTLERCLLPLPLNPGLFVTTLTNEIQQKQPCASSETSFYKYKQLLPVYLWAMEDIRPSCWTEYRERPGGCMKRKGPALPSSSVPVRTPVKPSWTEYRERPGGCMKRKGRASPSSTVPVRTPVKPSWTHETRSSQRWEHTH